MERIIYRKTLDLHKSGVQFTLQGFQTADNMSRILELSLMASGDTIDLPLEQLMAVMYVTTPNSIEPSVNDCTIKNNAVVCDVPQIVEEGITEVQIKLIETGVEGASGVLATPKFAIEVSKSNMDEEGATQNPTFSALETALAKAKGVYDSRVTRIVLSPDCIFSVYYADGTIYTSDAFTHVLANGELLIAKSYARGGTGIRDGEDTDNCMYYSNVSKSSSMEANTVMENSLKVLDEVRKHGVYTAFSFNFENGELEYISPMYRFDIDKNTGELVAIGETNSFDETVELLTNKVFESLNYSIAELKRLTTMLPIENGGTGATSADMARANLEVAQAIEDNEYPGCYYRIVDGEKEWINPPMVSHVEYRLTERFYTKPLFTKLILLNWNGDKYIEFYDKVGNARIVFVDGRACFNNNRVVPFSNSAYDGNHIQVSNCGSGDTFGFKLLLCSETDHGGNSSLGTGYIQVWYYKE